MGMIELAVPLLHRSIRIPISVIEGEMCEEKEAPALYFNSNIPPQALWSRPQYTYTGIEPQSSKLCKTKKSSLSSLPEFVLFNWSPSSFSNHLLIFLQKATHKVASRFSYQFGVSEGPTSILDAVKSFVWQWTAGQPASQPASHWSRLAMHGRSAMALQSIYKIWLRLPKKNHLSAVFAVTQYQS